MQSDAVNPAVSAADWPNRDVHPLSPALLSLLLPSSISSPVRREEDKTGAPSRVRYDAVTHVREAAMQPAECNASETSEAQAWGWADQAALAADDEPA